MTKIDEEFFDKHSCQFCNKVPIIVSYVRIVALLVLIKITDHHLLKPPAQIFPQQENAWKIKNWNKSVQNLLNIDNGISFAVMMYKINIYDSVYHFPDLTEDNMQGTNQFRTGAGL